MNNICLLVDEPAPGVWNMAVDEALTRRFSCNQNSEKGFLRFYRWAVPTLSFGYNQNILRLLDLAAAKDAGYDLVRRMTGGKMVFHAEEWTFSLGFRQSELKSSAKSTFLEMFIKAVEPLVEGLKKAGVPARFSDAREMKHSAANPIHCYAAAAGHSIFAGEKKLIGAAGVAKNDFLTVHGSLPIRVKFPKNEVFTNLARVDDGVNMTCLENFVDNSVIEALPGIIARSYAELFQCTVIKTELSAEESALAESLCKEKYADLNWKDKNRNLNSKIDS
jgi:lipoate-protein ligase A